MWDSIFQLSLTRSMADTLKWFQHCFLLSTGTASESFPTPVPRRCYSFIAFAMNPSNLLPRSKWEAASPGFWERVGDTDDPGALTLHMVGDWYVPGTEGIFSISSYQGRFLRSPSWPVTERIIKHGEVILLSIHEKRTPQSPILFGRMMSGSETLVPFFLGKWLSEAPIGSIR
jgi:hypothetical protein